MTLYIVEYKQLHPSDCPNMSYNNFLEQSEYNQTEVSVLAYMIDNLLVLKQHLITPQWNRKPLVQI